MPVPTATPALAPTPTTTPRPATTPATTPKPIPKVALVLDSSATVSGYWSDGTANVEVIASLRNEGDLRSDSPSEITISCSQNGELLNGCGEKMTLKLTDGYGPTTGVLTMRVPTGPVSLTAMHGSDGGESEVLEVYVPERIVGVDREVWECFSDTSYIETVLQEELGIGCGAWRSETVYKWSQDSPVRVYSSGQADWLPEFKKVFDELAPVMGLRVEWVDERSKADIVAYLGISLRSAAVSLGYFCGGEAQGCAETVIHPDRSLRGTLFRAAIVVYGLGQGDGPDFNELTDRNKNLLRTAMTHEVIHALSRMVHRTEALSIMGVQWELRTGMSPMDEALLRLHGNKLIKPGMGMDEIEGLVVFNDELLDPQPSSPTLVASGLVSDTYEKLREATSASFMVRTSSPDCGAQSEWAEYRVGNLVGVPSSFGWVEINTAETHVYSLRSGHGRNELWLQSPSGWKKVAEGEIPGFVPGWRADLSDPHLMLGDILQYADWEKAEIFLDSHSQATIRFHLNSMREDGPQSGGQVTIALTIDRDTQELDEYRMSWSLAQGDCPQYVIEATEGSYGVEFQFPEVVVRGSDLLDSCPVASLGVLSGYTKVTGNWARECGSTPGAEGYARVYRFSLEDWAFARFQLFSPDIILVNLFREDGAGETRVEWDAEGYLTQIHRWEA